MVNTTRQLLILNNYWLLDSKFSSDEKLLRQAKCYIDNNLNQCWQTMKQLPKEVLDNNMHHHDTMKTIATAYLRNQEYLVWEAVYHILPELNLRRIFLCILLTQIFQWKNIKHHFLKKTRVLIFLRNQI